MLETIFVILLVLWLLGMVTSYTLGGFIHGLLVLAKTALHLHRHMATFDSAGVSDRD